MKTYHAKMQELLTEIETENELEDILRELQDYVRENAEMNATKEEPINDLHKVARKISEALFILKRSSV